MAKRYDLVWACGAVALTAVLAGSCNNNEDGDPDETNNGRSGGQCDTCDPATYPAYVTCAQGSRVSCVRQTNGACTWSDSCSGTSVGGPISGSGGAPEMGGPSGSGGGAGERTRDAGASGSCAAAECAGQPVITIGCADGTTPRFSCTRGGDGRCRWGAPVCGGGQDAGTAGVACGENRCAAGLVCCNASCGRCAAQGVACTQEVCEPRAR